MLLIRLNLKKRRYCEDKKKKSCRAGCLAFYPDETQLVRATTNLSRSCLANSWAATGLAESEGRGGQLEPGSAKRRGERRNGRGGLQFQRQIWSAGRPGEGSERASERRCGGRPSRSSRSRWVLSRTGMIYRRRSRSSVALGGRVEHICRLISFPFTTLLVRSTCLMTA